MFNFTSDLLASATTEKREIASGILKAIYPGEKIIWQGIEVDDHGVDVIVGNRKLDIKFRSKDFGTNDLGLEIWSDVGGKVGWTRDDTKQTDEVIWIWADTLRWEKVNYPLLRQAFQANWEDWAAIYGTCFQQNIDSGNIYQSELVFVPKKALFREMERIENGQ